MMTPEPQILFPRSEVKIGNETVMVHELVWIDALDFLKQFGGYIGKLTFNQRGELAISPELVANLIANTDELSTLLLTKSTGRDALFVRSLLLGQVLDLLDAALALNLSEEILVKGKKIAGRFQEFAGRTPTPRIASPASPSAQPIPSSSSTDIGAPS